MFTATIQFCGAGGTSEAARQAGVSVDVAINHSPIAIASHASNHPETQHYCQSMEDCDPMQLPMTDYLLTSPCCTNHSLARGQKNIHQFDLFGDVVYDEKAENSRNTMEDVPRFCKAKLDAGQPYKIVVVENVVDVVKWRKYHTWLESMKHLGYEYKALFLNTQFFGVPQSRDRIYIVFCQPGCKPDLEFRPEAFCEYCERNVSAVQSWKRHHYGKYQQQYDYRCPACADVVYPFYTPAWTAIDWSLPAGDPIGMRKRPLKPKTIKRIQAGLTRYGSRDPLLVSLEFGGAGRMRPVTMPSMTQTTTQATALLLPPHADRTYLMSYYNNGSLKPVTEPIGTVTTVDRYALITASTDINECRLRMLSPNEVKALMGFPTEYVLKGTAKQQVWQAGNAVCPPIMKEIIRRCNTALRMRVYQS